MLRRFQQKGNSTFQKLDPEEGIGEVSCSKRACCCRGLVKIVSEELWRIKWLLIAIAEIAKVLSEARTEE